MINVLTMGLLLAYGVLYREVVAEFGEEYADQASKLDLKCFDCLKCCWSN